MTSRVHVDNPLLLKTIQQYSFAMLMDEEQPIESLPLSEYPRNVEFINSLTTLESVTIASHSCNELDFAILKLNNLQLKELRIGDYCFQETYVVEIRDMPMLKQIMVGDHSFTHFHDLEFIQLNPGECDSKLFIRDCPSLESFITGAFAFADFEICVLKSMI